MTQKFPRPAWLGAIALFAILFGLLTIKEGGAVLFNEAARVKAGSYVPFVVWFNFLAGFAYVAAGIGLWMRRSWAVRLAFGIAFATIITYAAFGIYVLLGNAFETRTVAALTLRVGIWILIAFLSYRAILRQPEGAR